MIINRSVVESYLGEKVEIKLFDGEIVVGKLHKTGEEQYKANNNLYFPKKYYFVEYYGKTSCLFRSSHIKRIKKVVY